jgi:hypothetical protein
MSHALRIFVFLLLTCSLAQTAAAQGSSGPRVAGSFAGVFGEGETNIAASGSVGYRFTRQFGFEFEVLSLPDFKIDEINTGGRGIGFLTNFVMEFPSDARWLTPYVQGGGGVINIRVEPDVRILADDIFDNRVIATPLRNFLRGRFPGGERPVQLPAQLLPSYSETNLALSVGGGVDFRVWEQLSVGPNITFTKLFGNFRDVELTRIGARASYRF